MSAHIDPPPILGVNAKHAMFVGAGLVTPDEGRQCSLGDPVIVMDRDEWFTLHTVEGIRMRGGKRLAVIGPRIPWPDGSIAARKLPAEPLASTDGGAR